jgi:uncharacterized protein (TIGR03382 family)
MFVMSRITAALVALTIVAAAGADASAYVWYRTSVPCDTDNPCGADLGTCNLGTHLCSGEGPPMRWFRTETTVRVSTAEPEEVSWNDYYEIVEYAFAQWDVPGCQIPQVDVVGTTEATSITTPTKLTDEPDNIVVFIKSANAWRALPGTTSTQIALTFIANNPVTGEIIDADIAVNDSFKFTTADDATSGVDLKSSITHECGHFFGMAHSLDQAATMYATYGNDIASRTAARTLENDDMDGVCALYEDVPEWKPPVTTPPSTPGDCAAGGGGAPAYLAFALFGLFALRRRRVARA